MTHRPRKVLLADPILFGHSLLYCRAALASEGFEHAQFTLVTQASDDADRQRLLELARTEPRLNVRILGMLDGRSVRLWDAWRAFAKGVRGVERLLQTESFDLVVYLYLDLALVFFALPVFRPLLQAHFQQKLAGLILRDNGLRPPISDSFKARLRGVADRWLFTQAVKSGAFRKVAFLDPRCADRARQLIPSLSCAYGVDPVFHRPLDAGQARSELGLKPDDFVILFFGTMSHRKCLVECLAWLCQAPLVKAKTVIVVAGPIFPPHRERILQQLAATAGHYRVIHHERFINDSQSPAYFAASDCLVCIYRDFTGSSSVLLHGACFGKPAIVSPGGTMADAVRKYQFGEIVSVDDTDGFLRAICRLAGLDQAERRTLSERAQAYGRRMDARRFMSQFE